MNNAAITTKRNAKNVTTAATEAKQTKVVAKRAVAKKPAEKVEAQAQPTKKVAAKKVDAAVKPAKKPRKPREPKAETQKVETVAVKKVVTTHALIDDAIYAAPMTSLVIASAVRRQVKGTGLKLTISEKAITLSTTHGAVIRVNLEVDNKQRIMTADLWRAKAGKNSKPSDGRWVRFSHTAGKNVKFADILKVADLEKAPQRKQLAHIKQYITDDVWEVLEDVLAAYQAHQAKIAK